MVEMARKSRGAAGVISAQGADETRAAEDATMDSPTMDNATAGSGDEDMADAPAAALTAMSTPAPTEMPSEPATPATPAPAPASATAQVIDPPTRKRRPGRPPKNRPADWDNPDATPGSNHPGSEAGTPAKRRRGRPPTGGGGRWARSRGGPSHVTQAPLDKEGNPMEVVDDEVVLPEDPEGETKVDKMGNLQGGREYRCRTFRILGKGERFYMLSTEPARCIGFRDSYLFFQKHKQLYKIIIDDEAKHDLIGRQIIPHSYKGRAIGVVTARSVFREFGARIIVGGRKIIDEYQAAAARADGDVEGELADPDDQLPRGGEPYNVNQYVAWHGASSVYHSGGPSVPTPSVKVPEPVPQIVLTDENWLLEAARSCSAYNSELSSMRRKNLNGVYDLHTNLIQYPRIMQPTHCRWEHVGPDSSSKGLSAAVDDTESGPDLGLEAHPAATKKDSPSTDLAIEPQNQPAQQPTVFPPVPALVARNYAVVDTYYESPPMSGLGVPGPDRRSYDVGPPGLLDVADDVVALLPEDCRRPFLEAREQERRWVERWGTEARDKLRRQPHVGLT